jgi:hypothetical protein
MNEPRVETFLALAAGPRAHSATETRLKQHGSIFFNASSGDLTPDGDEMLARIGKILAGAFAVCNWQRASMPRYFKVC